MNYLRIALIAITISAFSGSILAQIHCDGTRYIEPVFDQIDSTTGVVFGQNTTIAGAPKTLRMDVYYPASEFFFARPLVILAFGGSFLTGNRKQLRYLCLELAARGFVAATIDYRLFDAFALPMDSLLAMDVAIKATGDMKAAIRWFKESASGANEFGIDSSNIFIGGVSAGAIAALHAAYLATNDYEPGSYIDSVIEANGGIRGSSSTNFAFSDQVKGVVNFSGALKDARWIDHGEPTIISVHDEFDDVVPYQRAVSTAIGTPVELWGSYEIDRQAQQKGIRSDLYTVENSAGHVSYFIQTSSPHYEPVMLRTAYFLEYTVCNRIASVPFTNDPAAFGVYPNPTNDDLQIKSPHNIVSIRVLDASGDLLWQDEQASILTIKTSDLCAGSYFIMAQDEFGTVYNQAFVKTNP